ncbi:MAG: hypothetical protein LBQ50_05665, partial [Planctomycetaceae bacterium]|nr:hypothetical protein [Planctomycetaceae bacterium]
MKNGFILFGIILFLWGISLPVVGQDWALKQGNVWSRQAGAIKRSTDKPNDRNNKETIRLEHTGNNDWALSEGNRMAVKTGDVFELAAEMKSEGTGTASISVITRKKDGEVVEWTYGTKEIRGNTSWASLRTKFMVPPDIETIEPRIVGYGSLTVWIDGFSATKVESRNLAVKNVKPVKFDNKFLSVELEPSTGVFSVTDKRTNRVWSPSSVDAKNFIVLPKQDFAAASAVFSLLNTETLIEYDVSVTLEPDT